MAGIDKFKDTIITDVGRHMLISIGGGEGKITYTKAEAYGQNVSGMADEDIRKLTSLSDLRLSTQTRVSDIEDNTITVTADFNNKNLTDDVSFNSVAWFAKIDADDQKHNLKANQEYLLAVTPANGLQTLAAAPPDHRSSQTISINLNMAISNAAKVDMTVNEAGTVHFGELDIQLTKIKNHFDQSLANYYTKQEVDSKIANINVSQQIAGKADKDDVNKQLAGKADVTNVYNKTDINNMLSQKADKTTVDNALSSKADKQDVYTKPEVDAKFAPVTREQNDHENRIKQLEQRPYFEVKTFAKSQEAQASAWEAERQGYRMAIIQDS